jgi:hypothetical protein
MKGPIRTVSSRPPAAPKALSMSHCAGGRRCAVMNVQTASAKPMQANMAIVAHVSAASSPSNPSRITSRAAALIANRPTASAAIGNQRCCLICPPADLSYLRPCL